jgi:DNA-binding CsgD family transcriptional regulator
MLDNLDTAFIATGSGANAQAGTTVQARLGRELFMQLLDEVDYGMLLVDAQGTIVHANHAARHELASAQALCERRGKLAACVPTQSRPMGEAIVRACQGQRALLEMGLDGARLAIAFTPLAYPADGAQGSALVLCGKRSVCQALTIRCFVRLHSLTPAEEDVLKQICTGGKPEALARTLGVALATVRSHIQSIRRKTGAGSMSEVIKLMAALPPLVPSLKLH